MSATTGAIGVGDGESVAVGVGVGDGVAVGVGDGVGVGFAVAVGDGVGVGFAVALGVGATYGPRTTSPLVSLSPTATVIADLALAVITKL